MNKKMLEEVLSLEDSIQEDVTVIKSCVDDANIGIFTRFTELANASERLARNTRVLATLMKIGGDELKIAFRDSR